MEKRSCRLKSGHRSPEVAFEQTLEGEGAIRMVTWGKSLTEEQGRQRSRLLGRQRSFSHPSVPGLHAASTALAFTLS